MKLDKTISRVIPTGESSCVWVDAGLVSYKLCDSGFECENCGFDHVMRHQSQPASNSLKDLKSDILPTVRERLSGETADKEHNTLSPIGISDFKNRENVANMINEFFTSPTMTSLPEDRMYSKDHLWVKEIGRNRYRVGMDHYAAAFLSPPLSEFFGEDGGEIVLPQEGSASVHDTPFAWMILNDETVAVHSPVNGRTLRNNSQLKELPSLIGEDPYNSGWVSEVEVTKPDAIKKTCFAAKEAKVIYDEQFDKMAHTLSNFDDVKVGVTMMDGGLRHKSLKNILGQKQYVALLKKLL
ncbi:MAG: glycine cleavage system protein H [Candidatus Kryptoniota bacterium]